MEKERIKIMIKVRGPKNKDIQQIINLYSEFLKDQSDKNKYCHISYALFCKKHSITKI